MVPGIAEALKRLDPGLHPLEVEAFFLEPNEELAELGDNDPISPRDCCWPASTLPGWRGSPPSFEPRVARFRAAGAGDPLRRRAPAAVRRLAPVCGSGAFTSGAAAFPRSGTASVSSARPRPDPTIACQTRKLGLRARQGDHVRRPGRPDLLREAFTRTLMIARRTSRGWWRSAPGASCACST